MESKSRQKKMLIWNSLVLLLSWKINHAAKNKKSVLTGFDDTELKLLHEHPNDDQEWIQPRNKTKESYSSMRIEFGH